jgi:hypothetical protein
MADWYAKISNGEVSWDQYDRLRLEARKQKLGVKGDVPDWWLWVAEGNPPSWQRQLWRREARTKQNRALRNCRDYEELVIETRTGRLTSLWDWY